MDEIELLSVTPGGTLESVGGPVLENGVMPPELFRGDSGATIEPAPEAVARLEQLSVGTGTLEIVGIGPQGPPGSGTAVDPYSAIIGDGSTTVFTVSAATHGQTPVDGIKVRVMSVAVGDEWVTYYQVDGEGNVLVAFTNPPSVGQFQLIIEG